MDEQKQKYTKMEKKLDKHDTERQLMKYEIQFLKEEQKRLINGYYDID